MTTDAAAPMGTRPEHARMFDQMADALESVIRELQGNAANIRTLADALRADSAIMPSDPVLIHLIYAGLRNRIRELRL